MAYIYIYIKLEFSPQPLGEWDESSQCCFPYQQYLQDAQLCVWPKSCPQLKESSLVFARLSHIIFNDAANQLSKSTSSSKTSTRGFCYQFQRFQAKGSGG